MCCDDIFLCTIEVVAVRAALLLLLRLLLGGLVVAVADHAALSWNDSWRAAWLLLPVPVPLLYCLDEDDDCVRTLPARCQCQASHASLMPDAIQLPCVESVQGLCK